MAVGLSALTVLLTWPLARRAGGALVGAEAAQTAWVLAWDLHALAVAPLRLFDANMFHPHRWTLAYTEHLLGLLPLAAPAHLAGAGPVLVHNTVWLATFPLVGLALFWLVRDLTGSGAAAAVAATLYAFSHVRFGMLGDTAALAHAGLPLMLLGLDRAIRDGGRWRDVALAAAALALQTLASWAQGAYAGVAGALFLLWAALPATRPPLGRLWRRGAIAAGLLALLLLPLALPYAIVQDEIGLAADPAVVAGHAARPSSYLRLAAVTRWRRARPGTAAAGRPALFPGAAALGLAAIGLAAALRRGRARPVAPAQPGRWPRRLDLPLSVGLVAVTVDLAVVGSGIHPARPGAAPLGPWALGAIVAALLVRRVVNSRPVPLHGLGWLGRLAWPNRAGYYLALTAVGALATFGPALDLGGVRLHPVYRQLTEWLPAFDALRTPARFGVLVTTGLAVLAGSGAAAVARRLPRPRWRALALAGAAAAAIAEAWPVPLPLVPAPADPGPAHWLATRPGLAAVAILPLRPPERAGGEAPRLLASTVHWRPLVNGDAPVSPPEYPETVATLNTFPAAEAVARLRATYVQFVVVELDHMDADARARLLAPPDELPPGVTRAARFGATAVFEIGPAP